MKVITFAIFSTLCLAGTAAAQQGWVKLTSGTAAVLNHISLVGRDTVYVSGDTLLRSTDAGATWEGLTGAPAGSGVLDFRDDTTGFLVSNGIVYKTTNGGLTWANAGGGYVGTIQFIGADTGWAFGQGFLARTTDNGNTWQNFGQVAEGNGMAFSDALHGFIMGNAGYDSHTHSYGASWAGTTNGGLTWSGGYAEPSTDVNGKAHSGIPGDVDGLATLNADTVYTSGLQLGRTTDGGADWDTIAYPGVDGYNSFIAITFPDYLHGTVVGTSGWVSHTSDGGLTWQRQTSRVLGNLNAVYFVNGSLGYACGGNGAIIKTTNGGVAWVRLTPGIDSVTGRVYPNPANAMVTIRYKLPMPQHVWLSTFTTKGDKVGDYISGAYQNVGWQNITIDTRRYASGNYVYDLIAGGYYTTGKFAVMH